jgi:hypothetical protein
MIGAAGLALLLLAGVAVTAAAQNVAPSATPTTGAVGSAALRNGYPGAGGAVALPTIANSPTTTTLPLAGTTTSLSTTSTGSSASGSPTATSGAGQASGAGGGGVGTQGGGTGGSRGSTNAAGAATATGSPGTPTWVLCPPSGAPGLEPLFTGTALSCAP